MRAWLVVCGVLALGGFAACPDSPLLANSDDPICRCGEGMDLEPSPWGSVIKEALASPW